VLDSHSVHFVGYYFVIMGMLFVRGEIIVHVAARLSSCMIGTRTSSPLPPQSLGRRGWKNVAMAPIGSTAEVAFKFTIH